MNDDRRWTAVLERDTSRSPDFVYGVTSTRIFCRAGCPSRTPRRDRVQFFAAPEGARSAGFRPCKRCRPEAPSTDAAALARVRVAASLIHAEPERAIASVARELGTTTRQLQRHFADLLGLSPRDYRAACRLSQFKREAGPDRDLIASILDAGFGASARLYELSGALGMTPGTYRSGGQGEQIRYTTNETQLGTVLLAATSAGVCAVRFGNDTDAVLEELHVEFPAAQITEASNELGPWIELVTAYLEGHAPLLELPCDVRGTAFQLQVWSAMRAIPRGETRSYGELAEQLGIPGGARAVGNACGSNPLAIAVPCHRVLPASGGTGAYRWGADRKERLLATEAAGD